MWPNELLYSLIDKMMDRAKWPGDLTNFVNLGIATLWQGDIDVPLYVIARTTCDVDYNRAPEDKATMVKEITEMWRAFIDLFWYFKSQALLPTRLNKATEFCNAYLKIICKYDCDQAVQKMLERSEPDMKTYLIKTLWYNIPKHRCISLLMFMFNQYPPKDYHHTFLPVSQWTSDYRAAACIGAHFHELDKGQRADVFRDICSRSEYDPITRAFIQAAKEANHVELLTAHINVLGENEISLYLHAGGVVSDWVPMILRVVTNDPDYKGWGLRSNFILQMIRSASAENMRLPKFEIAKDPIKVLLNHDPRIHTVTHAQMLDMAVYMHTCMKEYGEHKFNVLGLVRLCREILDMIKHLAVIQKCSLYDERYSTLLEVKHEIWKKAVKMFEDLQPVHTLLDEEFEWLLMYNPHKRKRDEDSDCEDNASNYAVALIT